MKPAVIVEKVSKRFGRLQAVREASLVLNPGELVALVGHNGAGKTTLMKLMLGLIRPSRGEIGVLGENPVIAACAVKRRLGYLPENAAFNATLTARETLTFYARLKGEPVGASLELLDRVGLAQAANRRVGTFSKGMRQRLGLAQALLGSPDVLLLDEPTTGLDPEFRQTFYDIMHDLRDRGAALLLSSHALTELEERADRVVILNEGAVVADGTLAQLRQLADLPNRIVVRMAEGSSTEKVARLAGATPASRVNGRVNDDVIELACPERDKMAVIRQVAAEGTGVADIETIPPSLDELYVHFLHSREQAR